MPIFVSFKIKILKLNKMKIFDEKPSVSSEKDVSSSAGVQPQSLSRIGDNNRFLSNGPRTDHHNLKNLCFSILEPESNEPVIKKELSSFSNKAETDLGSNHSNNLNDCSNIDNIEPAVAYDKVVDENLLLSPSKVVPTGFVSEREDIGIGDQLRELPCDSISNYNISNILICFSLFVLIFFIILHFSILIYRRIINSCSRIGSSSCKGYSIKEFIRALPIILFNFIIVALVVCNTYYYKLL